MTTSLSKRKEALLAKYRSYPYMSDNTSFDDHYNLYYCALPIFAKNNNEFTEWLNAHFSSKENLNIENFRFCDLNSFLLKNLDNLTGRVIKWFASKGNTLNLTEDVAFKLLKASVEHHERPYYAYKHDSDSIAAYNFSDELKSTDAWLGLTTDLWLTRDRVQRDSGLALFYSNYIRGGDYLDPGNQNPSLLGDHNILPHHRLWLIKNLDWRKADLNWFRMDKHNFKNACLFIKYDSGVSDSLRNNIIKILDKNWDFFLKNIRAEKFILSFMLNSGDDYDKFIKDYPHHSDIQLALKRRLQHGTELSPKLKEVYFNSEDNMWTLKTAAGFFGYTAPKINPSFSKSANLWITLNGYNLREVNTISSEKKKVVKRMISRVLTEEMSTFVDPDYPYEHLKEIFDAHVKENPFTSSTDRVLNEE